MEFKGKLMWNSSERKNYRKQQQEWVQKFQSKETKAGQQAEKFWERDQLGSLENMSHLFILPEQ